MESQVILICISQVIKDAEQFFKYISTIWVSFMENIYIYIYIYIYPILSIYIWQISLIFIYVQC
jgi:hypothetical protein